MRSSYVLDEALDFAEALGNIRSMQMCVGGNIYITVDAANGKSYFISICETEEMKKADTENAD